MHIKLHIIKICIGKIVINLCINESVINMRTRAFRRNVRNKTIRRKKNIVLARDGHDWYKFDGQYSKGKIFCDCGLCKFTRKYGLATVKDVKESEIVKSAIDDYYLDSQKGA